MSDNFIYQDKRRVDFTVEGSKLLSKYSSQCSTSLNFSYPNPTSLHFQHAQARSHASNSYLKSAKRRWIVANNILSIMAGGQARGERRANVITAEWTGHTYGNLALEKQHLVHRSAVTLDEFWGEISLQKDLIEIFTSVRVDPDRLLYLPCRHVDVTSLG